MRPALVVIDLQNDFVSAAGTLKEKHIPVEDIVRNLHSLCEHFASNVVFVRSEYLGRDFYEKNPPKREEGFRFRPTSKETTGKGGNTVNTLDHLSGTHIGKKKLCAPGTQGAEFPPEVENLVSKFSSETITKNWYSAFSQTSLHEWLQGRGIGDGPLYFAGVTANNCVLASLTDAFFLGYRVRAIRECIGATSSKLKEEALNIVQRYYGQVISVGEVLEELDSRNEGEEVEGEDRKLCHQGQKYFGKRTLYWVNGSIPSWRVMLCLALKKLSYHRKRLHVMTPVRETRVPEFLAINPRGKTPVLIDEDGTVIAESMAILQYLETYYPNSAGVSAMPDPKEEKKKHVMVLQRFHESENLHNVFEDIELLFEPDYTKNECNKERILDAYRNTQKELRCWEQHLTETPFVAGTDFSLADCSLYPNVAYLLHRGLNLDKEGLQKLKEYHERVQKLPCAIEALPQGYERIAKNNLFNKVYDMLDD